MRRLPAALVLVCAIVLSQPFAAGAQSRVERNVIYGMYSALALLMDVHHPDTPKGLGVIYVPGSAWQAPLSYGASGLKDSNYTSLGAPTTETSVRVATPHPNLPEVLTDVVGW